MNLQRRRALEEMADIRKIEADEEARAFALDLAERSEDPLILALCKAEEIRRSRILGQQQRAVVAGAELLPHLEALVAAERDDERWALGLIARGLSSAVRAALDVPEVPFAAIDALIDAVARVLRDLGLRELAADQLRARRYHVSGDQERVTALVEGLIPHVNYTNADRQQLGCPGCVLSTISFYLGPTADLGLLEEMLTPVFEGQLIYPNEDPKVLRAIRLDGGPRCPNSLGAHMHYARALLWRGRVAEAEEHAARVTHLDLDECYLLPMIFFLEVAMASGNEARIRGRVRLLRPRVEAHEDTQEAMLGTIRVAQALAILGEDEADQERLWGLAEAHAARLDGRLTAPRHRAEVVAERSGGAPIFAAPRGRPTDPQACGGV